MNSTTKQIMRVGDTVTQVLPHSEVCDFMKVAGKVMSAQVVEGYMAQLLNHDGSKFSFPIGLGEAGIYTDQNTSQYYVPSHLVIKFTPRPKCQVILYITRQVGDKVVDCSPEHVVNKFIDEWRGEYECTWERDEMGCRARMTLPIGNPFTTPPAAQVYRLAKKQGIPAALED